MFTRIDHVAVLVPDLEKAIQLYSLCFGVKFDSRERNEEQGFEVALFKVGDASFELLSPTRPDSVIASRLEKHGPGIHHIGFSVDNIRQCMANVEANGLMLTSDIPRKGTDGSLISFIHPKSLFGTMIEMVEIKRDQGKDLSEQK